MTDVAQRLYAERQRYLDDIAVLGETLDGISKISEYVRHIEYIDGVLTRLAKHQASRHWPTEFALAITD